MYAGEAVSNRAHKKIYVKSQRMHACRLHGPMNATFIGPCNLHACIRWLRLHGPMNGSS